MRTKVLKNILLCPKRMYNRKKDNAKPVLNWEKHISKNKGLINNKSTNTFLTL